MPRTRIRGRAPFSTTTGGSTGGTTNPAGSSLTVDDPGFLEVFLQLAETAATPADATSFALTASSAETAAAPVDTGFALVTLATLAEPALAAPAEARTSEVTIGTASVAQTPAGSWTNPNNATGLPDDVYARYTAPAGITSPRAPLGILTGSFATVAAPTRETQVTPALLVMRVAVSIALLTTGSVSLSYSTNGGTSFIPITTITATTAVANYTVSAAVTTFTWSALANLRWAVEADLQGSVTTASFCDVDASVVILNTTGT